jgi:hypothetical protein
MNTTLRYLCLVAASTLLGARLSAQPAPPVFTDDTRAYFETLRSQFNTNKIATYNEVLKLTPAEADKFWPLYRAYEKENAGIGDRKLELLRVFFKDYQAGEFNDAKAKVLAEKFLRNLEERTKLWKKYHKKISKAVSPMRAAQFLQIEYQLAIFIDLAIASDMPGLAPGAPAGPLSK